MALVVTLAIALTVVVSGCVAASPDVTPAPSASAKPLFATDAEALKAAEVAYAAYLIVADQILADGGKNPERIEGLAVRDALDGLQESAKSFRTDGLRIVGHSAFDSTSVQYNYADGRDRDVVAIYVCLDVGDVDLLNAAGNSLVSENRPDRQPFELSFDVVPTPKIHLALASRVPWSESLCQ